MTKVEFQETAASDRAALERVLQLWDSLVRDYEPFDRDYANILRKLGALYQEAHAHLEARLEK